MTIALRIDHKGEGLKDTEFFAPLLKLMALELLIIVWHQLARDVESTNDVLSEKLEDNFLGDSCQWLRLYSFEEIVDNN